MFCCVCLSRVVLKRRLVVARVSPHLCWCLFISFVSIPYDVYLFKRAAISALCYWCASFVSRTLLLSRRNSIKGSFYCRCLVFIVLSSDLASLISPFLLFRVSFSHTLSGPSLMPVLSSSLVTPCQTCVIFALVRRSYRSYRCFVYQVRVSVFICLVLLRVYAVILIGYLCVSTRVIVCVVHSVPHLSLITLFQSPSFFWSSFHFSNMSDTASVYSFDYATSFSGETESVSSSRSRPFARHNVRFPTVDPALLQEESFEERHRRYIVAVYGYDLDSPHHPEEETPQDPSSPNPTTFHWDEINCPMDNQSLGYGQSYC